MNLYRPSDLLAVHCHAATCSLASVALPPSFLLFFGREQGREGDWHVRRRRKGGGVCVEEGWVS